MNTEDYESSGHPKMAVTKENLKRIQKINLYDRKMKLIETADGLRSQSNILNI